MTGRRLPVWCSRCTNRTAAAWHVAGRGRAEVAKVARQESLFDLGEVG